MPNGQLQIQIHQRQQLHEYINKWAAGRKYLALGDEEGDAGVLRRLQNGHQIPRHQQNSLDAQR